MGLPGYKSYANENAWELAKWALECPERVKAGKIKKAADNMEENYRGTKEYKVQYEFGNEFKLPLFSLKRRW